MGILYIRRYFFILDAYINRKGYTKYKTNNMDEGSAIEAERGNDFHYRTIIKKIVLGRGRGWLLYQNQHLLSF